MTLTPAVKRMNQIEALVPAALEVIAERGESRKVLIEEFGLSPDEYEFLMKRIREYLKQLTKEGKYDTDFLRKVELAKLERDEVRINERILGGVETNELRKLIEVKLKIYIRRAALMGLDLQKDVDTNEEIRKQLEELLKLRSAEKAEMKVIE